jgi:RNA polymerase sigma-70 factor (ECF subfamily)
MGRDDARVQQITSAARAARPAISFDEDGFATYLRERPERLAAPLERAGDLALAYACGAGDPVALRALETDYLAQLASIVPSRYHAEAAEVAQHLRTKLLLPDATGHVKIADYSGRGGLRAWLRVAAVRTALNLKRSRAREVLLDEDRDLAERTAFDLEIDHLKRRYRGEFKAAFTAAFDALTPRARNLLRHHYLDGVTMEAIGTIYNVHRITVVRWMEQARATLAKETRRELRARLRVDGQELESILRLIDSQLEVTMRALVGS